MLRPSVIHAAVLAAVLTLAACSNASDDGSGPVLASEGAQFSQPVAASSQADDTVAKSAAKAVKIEENGKLFSFSYTYPAQAAAIPALKAELDREKDESRAQLVEEAKAGRDMAQDEGFGFTPYERSVDWSVVAELPGWLSLLGDSYEFAGGAHGNSGSTALLWDKASGKRRDPLSLFVSKEAFNAALRGAYCQALNKERAKRREEPVNANSGNRFDDCVKPSDVTILLGSADKVHFTRVGLIADAYVAGSYFEGSYEITLPVTPNLIRAVKPEYRSAFAVGR